MANAISLQSFGNHHGIAEHIATSYISWEASRQVWLKRVREVIQYIYATSTRETQNSSNGWSHSTHIPKLTQIHDNLGANYHNALFGGRQVFGFEAATVEDDTVDKRKAIVAYLNTKHEYSGFTEEVLKCLDDWVQTGNCFALVEYVREMTKDPRSGADIVQYEGPKLRRISPYDIVFDATATDFSKTGKIFRQLLSLADFIGKVESTLDETYIIGEVNELKRARQCAAGMRYNEINKDIQRHMDGFATYADYLQSGQIELLEYIGDLYDQSTGELHKDVLITVADRQFVVRYQTRSDLQGMGRIYHAGWRRRPDNLWAQGPLDNLVGMQYLINHLENARADAFDQMLSPDRVHVGNVQIEQDGPVTNYYIDDGNGSVSNLAPDATVLQADFQIQVKEAQMEAYAGAPREALGIRSPGEKTAFEVQQLQTAASRLFQTKAEQFERTFLEPIINGEIEVAVVNLQGGDVARVLDTDEGVAEFMDITVDDLTVRGKLKARGASHFAKRARLAQELQMFNNIITGDQALAVHFPAKRRAKAWAEALQLDQYDLYVPFGQIDESIEAQQAQQAAMSVLDDYAAAEEGLVTGAAAASSMGAPDVMTRVEIDNG